MYLCLVSFVVRVISHRPASPCDLTSIPSTATGQRERIPSEVSWSLAAGLWVLEGYVLYLTLIAANPWGRMVPQVGVMVNSFGFTVCISSLVPGSLLFEACSQLGVLFKSLPSLGMRSLKVMGTKDVLLREHIKVWGNPGKQNTRWEINAPHSLP